MKEVPIDLVVMVTLILKTNLMLKRPFKKCKVRKLMVDQSTVICPQASQLVTTIVPRNSVIPHLNHLTLCSWVTYLSMLTETLFSNYSLNTVKLFPSVSQHIQKLNNQKVSVMFNSPTWRTPRRL